MRLFTVCLAVAFAAPASDLVTAWEDALDIDRIQKDMAEYIVDARDPPSQNLLVTNLNFGCSRHGQLFGSIRQRRGQQADVELWSIDTEVCSASGPREFLWNTLQRRRMRTVELAGPVFTRMLDHHRHRHSTHMELILREAAIGLGPALRAVTQMASVVYQDDGEHLYMPGVVVLYRANLARDLPSLTMEILFYAIRRAINDYQDLTNINLFIFPRAVSHNDGIEEALEYLLAVNQRMVLNLNESTDPSMVQRGIGVLRIGSSTLAVALPVAPPAEQKNIWVRAVDVPLHPSQGQSAKSVRVFATSFVNHGLLRGLAFVVKQHCEDEGSTCLVPCLPRGWRQSCQVGIFRVPQDIDVSTGNVVPRNNVLLRPGIHCGGVGGKHALTIARLQEVCTAVHLPPQEGDLETRISIKGCHTLLGTGNAAECSRMIHDYLVDQQLPSNHNAVSVGVSMPAEMGRSGLVSRTERLVVLGGKLENFVYMLQRHGWLPKRPRNILQEIVQILDSLCSLTVRESEGSLTLQMSEGEAQAPAKPAASSRQSLGKLHHHNGEGNLHLATPRERWIARAKATAQSKGSPRRVQVPASFANATLPATWATVHSCFALNYLVKLVEAVGLEGVKLEFEDYRQRRKRERAKRMQVRIGRRPPKFALEANGPLLDGFDRQTAMAFHQGNVAVTALEKANALRAEVDGYIDAQLSKDIAGQTEPVAGNIIRLAQMKETVNSIFVLGAHHWKGEYYMSPLYDTLSSRRQQKTFSSI